MDQHDSVPGVPAVAEGQLAPAPVYQVQGGANDPLAAGEPKAKRPRYNEAQLTAVWRMATGDGVGDGPKFVDWRPKVKRGYKKIMADAAFAKMWNLNSYWVRDIADRVRKQRQLQGVPGGLEGA